MRQRDCSQWLFECLFAELNLRNKKWLFGCLYNAHRDKIISHFDTISNVLDKVCADYENLILLSDFNVETEEKHVWIHEYVQLEKISKT